MPKCDWRFSQFGACFGAQHVYTLEQGDAIQIARKVGHEIGKLSQKHSS